MTSIKLICLSIVPLKAALLLVMLICSLPAVAQNPPSASTVPGPPSDNASIKDTTSPQEAQKRPTRWGEPTEVRVGIFIVDVDAVDSANQSFSASVFVEARWNAPLLKHEGPGPLVKQTSSVWTPRLGIVGQQQAWNAFPSYVEIQPSGEVVYRQKTWGWFSQPLNLKNFPFDKQKLTIHLVAAGLLETDVRMVPLRKARGPGSEKQSTSAIAETFSLPDFKVTSWQAGPAPYFPVRGVLGTAGFSMDIEVERIPSYYVWRIIFPLCLIVIMSWIPRWRKPKSSEASIGVSATAFLTLVAYLFAIAVMLPRVPYLTRLDEFILMSTVLVFAGLLQTILSAYLVDIKKSELVSKMNLASRLIHPIFLLLVLAMSFYTGFSTS